MGPLPVLCAQVPPLPLAQDNLALELTQGDSELTLLQRVTADVGDPIASTLATALWAMGAVMPPVAYACARLATKVLGVSSVSTGLAFVPLSQCAHRHAQACDHTHENTCICTYMCTHVPEYSSAHIPYMHLSVVDFKLAWSSRCRVGAVPARVGVGGEEGSLGPCLCPSKACGWAESE